MWPGRAGAEGPGPRAVWGCVRPWARTGNRGFASSAPHAAGRRGRSEGSGQPLPLKRGLSPVTVTPETKFTSHVTPTTGRTHGGPRAALAGLLRQGQRAHGPGRPRRLGWRVRAPEKTAWRDAPALTDAGRLPGPGRDGWKDERTQGLQLGQWSPFTGRWAQYSEGSHCAAGNDRPWTAHKREPTSLKSTSRKKLTVLK